jgi:predicted TPR repeat methyltransferase
MSEFGKYGQFYSALNAQKEYSREVDVILSLANMYGGDIYSVADLGCGVGGHLSLLVDKIGASKGIGVDISESMLREASKTYKNNHKLSFFCEDISAFRSKTKFNLVTSLFHVVSYIPDYGKLEQLFQRVSALLEPGGLFVFDYWSTSGVISNGLSETIRTAQVDGSTVTRKANSVLRDLDNSVDVTFSFEISFKGDLVDSFKEVHSMRYYSPAELIYFAESAGLVHVTSFDSMSIGQLTNKAWASMSVFRKE